MKNRIITMLIIIAALFSFTPAFAASEKPVVTKIAAFTFDDGPTAKYTPTLLDALKARSIKATFFVVGSMASANPKIVKRAENEGHQIANHTQNHKALTSLSSTGISSEINTSANFLKTILKRQTFLLRPPYGSISSTVRSLANTPIIMWSVDPTNGKYPTNETKLYNGLISQMKDGAIVLMHDTSAANVNASIRTIDVLRKQGYEFVTLDELFRIRGIKPVSGQSYTSAPPASDPTYYDESKLSSHWAYSYMKRLSDANIMVGDGVGMKPNNYLTREMAAKLVYCLLGSPEVEKYSNTSFSDVPKGKWYSDPIEWCAQNGIILGVGNGKFALGYYMSREELYALAERVLVYKNAMPYVGKSKLSYTDDWRISSWAKSTISTIRNAGFASENDGELFRPKDTITRAESAEILCWVRSLI